MIRVGKAGTFCKNSRGTELTKKRFFRKTELLSLTFHPPGEPVMRRHDRECSESSFLQDLLQQADAVTVAFHAEEYPYVLPLNFVFMNNALYVHSAGEGRKLDCLKNNPCVGFSIHKILEIDREHATTRYESLCGEGRAVLVDASDEKQQALAALAGKYRSRCRIPVPEHLLNMTAVIRIDILRMSGKRNPISGPDGQS